MAGYANPTGSAAHACAGANASPKLTSRADPDYVQLLVQTDAGTNLAAPVLVPHYVGGQDPGKIVFASNDIISVYATAKQHFQILAHSREGQFFQLACNISGQQVKLS
jgi:hypothetical protein